MLRKLWFFLLIELFAATLCAAHAADIRKENLGDFEGVLGRLLFLTSPPEPGPMPPTPAGIRENYETLASGLVRSGGFESDMPLQVEHSALDRKTCHLLFLDQNHDYEQMWKFAQDYMGARVRLLDVEAVYSGNRRSHCTFTDFEVLASRDEVTREREAEAAEREAERKRAESEARSFRFEGDLTGHVLLNLNGSVRFSGITAGGLSDDEWMRQCRSVVLIEPRLEPEQVFTIREALKETQGRGKLVNVRIDASLNGRNKCTAQQVVPST